MGLKNAEFYADFESIEKVAENSCKGITFLGEFFVLFAELISALDLAFYDTDMECNNFFAYMSTFR
jgi:hypothetical protein